MTWPQAFDAFAERKSREAASASVTPLETIDAGPAWTDAFRIGNEWSRHHYDGDFILVPPPDKRPSISLVFVQSRDGNTGAPNPDDLGGGDTDKHLIYEGLSRVAADAVLAGAATATGRHAFFSVWRRELVDLRRQLNLSRHPTQIVVSKTGRLDVAGTLLFNLPDVPVIVIAGPECRARCGGAFKQRSWIRVVPIDRDDWNASLTWLRRDLGINRISAVGGRRVATVLLDAGLVQDLCLTTTNAMAGEPGTPFYIGTHRPRFDVIVRKRERLPSGSIMFEHLAVEADGSARDGAAGPHDGAADLHDGAADLQVGRPTGPT